MQTKTIHSTETTDMPNSRKTLFVLAAALLLLALLLAYRPGAAPEVVSASEAAAKTVAVAPAATAPTPAAPSAARKTGVPAALKTSPPATGPVPVPKLGARAQHHTWVSAGFGPGEDELGLGYLGGGTMLHAPQGFVPTADGRLLVLDSNKQRLVEYDAKGVKQRAIKLDGLVMPADVAVAQDGTILVADHGGVQTKGILMLRPDGTKLRELPQIQPSDMLAFYAVGNDFYFDMSQSSIHGGDTSGDMSDETPGVYNYEDAEVVPGLVAPDGRTVVMFGAEEEGGLERGEFFVNTIRGEPPEHLFTQYFKWPRPLGGVLFAQADARGQLYVVLHDSAEHHEMLLCLDAEGHALGLADMGRQDEESAELLRRWSVTPQGGLVALRLAPKGIRYEWYDCH